MRSLPSYSVKLEHMWESKSPGIWSTLRQLIEGKKFACASCERQLLVATSLSNHQPFALPTFLCYTYRSGRHMMPHYHIVAGKNPGRME